MNTLDEACSKIRDYLSDWYNKAKRKGINGKDLYAAKQVFIKDNPDYKRFDFDINVGFDVYDYQPGCLDGCCITRATVRGIYVDPIDWKASSYIALKKSKTLDLIKTLC